MLVTPAVGDVKKRIGVLAVCEPRSRLSERTLSQEEEEEGQNKTHCTAPVYASTPHTHITCKYYTHAYTKDNYNNS